MDHVTAAAHITASAAGNGILVLAACIVAYCTDCGKHASLNWAAKCASCMAAWTAAAAARSAQQEHMPDLH